MFFVNFGLLPFNTNLGLLPFYTKLTKLSAFTVLNEKRRTFTPPPPYVSVTHAWPASPCSALVPEMLVGSDGTSQRLRTRRSLQEARDHHVFALDPLVCTRGLGVGHCPGRF